MSSPPTFAVVTVTRQDLDGLRSTWESLVHQTFGDFEWVVVDGASTDGTVEWLTSLRDDRVRWASEPDDGIYDAMNRGIARAIGSVVVFMNAGDTFAHPETLSTVAAHHELHGWRWAYGMMRIVQPSGELVRVQFPYPWSRQALVAGRSSIGHQAVYFAVELLRELGGYRPQFGVEADQELMMRAAYAAEPGVIPEVLADLAAGGVSYGGRPDAFVWAAWRMRRDHGRYLYDNPTRDKFATVGLAGEKWVRHFGSQLIRRS